MGVAVQHNLPPRPKQAPSKDASSGRVRFTRTYRQLVKGKNINEQTLLATDYLNHFNEVIMLIGMVPSMPECLEDVLEWRPKSYQDHFRESVFSDKELAVEAYEHAPIEYRVPFDTVIERLDSSILEAVSDIETLVSGDPAVLEARCATVGTELQAIVDKASAIINGTCDSLHQDEIDVLMDEAVEDTIYV